MFFLYFIFIYTCNYALRVFNFINNNNYYIYFLNKKLKKYTNIYHKDGLDGVWLYFYNKNIKKTGLSNFIDKKKIF